MDLPDTISRAAWKTALADLGIPTADLLNLDATPRAITVEYRRRNADGQVLAAGDDVSRVTATIGISD